VEEGQYSLRGYVRVIKTEPETRWYPYGYVELSHEPTTEEPEWVRYEFRSKKHARRFEEDVRIGDLIVGGYEYNDRLAEFRVEGRSASLRELEEKVDTLAGSRKLTMNELAGIEPPAPASVAELQQRIEELERLVKQLVENTNEQTNYYIS
jgi:hypothetical protein